MEDKIIQYQEKYFQNTKKIKQTLMSQYLKQRNETHEWHWNGDKLHLDMHFICDKTVRKKPKIGRQCNPKNTLTLIFTKKHTNDVRFSENLIYKIPCKCHTFYIEGH